MNIRNVLDHQLSKPSHIVKVEDKENNLRLKKDTALMRYAYSYEDLLNDFGSLDNFLNELAKRGYQKTTFTFQRTYGTPDKTTYHTMEQKTIDFSELSQPHQTVPALNHQTAPAYQPTNTGNFLAGAQSMQYLGAFVEAERANDYKKRINDLEEDLRDEKSKRRRLEEENHSLKLKVDTAEEKAQLTIQKELLSKKSVLESEGFQKLAEGLGGIIPQVLPALMNKPAAPQAALGSPASNLTVLQRQAVEVIKSNGDDVSSLLIYLSQNMSKGLLETINNYIENGEN